MRYNRAFKEFSATFVVAQKLCVGGRQCMKPKKHEPFGNINHGSI